MSDQIVDACTLINLYGSTRPLDILRSIGGMHVTPQVRKESLGIRIDNPENADELLTDPLDLTEAIAKGLLTQCELSANEFELMVVYARELDDGEASSLAVAHARGWKLATDDKKARRIAEGEGVALISTAELIERWSQSDQVSKDEIAQTLQAIAKYARFCPPPSDPLSKWWRRCLDSR